MNSIKSMFSLAGLIFGLASNTVQANTVVNVTTDTYGVSMISVGISTTDPYSSGASASDMADLCVRTVNSAVDLAKRECAKVIGNSFSTCRASEYVEVSASGSRTDTSVDLLFIGVIPWPRVDTYHSYPGCSVKVLVYGAGIDGINDDFERFVERSEQDRSYTNVLRSAIKASVAPAHSFSSGGASGRAARSRHAVDHDR